MVEQLFFELIRVAIGNQSSLSQLPDAKEWGKIYSIAEKQGLVGICFAGLQRLGADADEGFARIGMSEMLYLTWMGMAAGIRQRNKIVNRQCVEFKKRLDADGYKSCILKGQAVASLYGSIAGLRQSGDIDTWMMAEPDKVIEWARATGYMYYYDYHHADLNIFSDTEVELHYRPSLSRNLVRNVRLQKWFREEGEKHIVYREDLGFAVPNYTFNVVLTMNHNFWHLLYEGVGFRQFMDLYFVLCTPYETQYEKEKRHEATLQLLKHLKLQKFTSASMWIMKEIFRLEEESLLCAPDEDAGKFLLNEIMQAGNFGKHDDRLMENRYKTSRVGLMWAWMRHTFRLFKYYPTDVLWTPIGILRISIWRRWHYRNKNEQKNI